MARRNKTRLTKFLSLLTAVVFCFSVFTVPVSAEATNGSSGKKDEKTKTTFLEDVNTEEVEPAVVEPVFKEGTWNRVHSNPAVFEKNFILSPQQKKESITQYEQVVKDLLTEDMSDLEKYYTLAVWLNHYVSYDWDFWPGGYDFDYYSHQWDVYGILKEQKSVCAGIAVAYADLCHAADLPCKFVRMKPFHLDHTINYIPNINGHAYYIDVTENIFFMSKFANPWKPLDLDYSHIPEDKIPDDGSFEYYVGNNTYSPSGIKEYYETSFDTWFNEWALHKNTKKKFKTEYVNKGSSTPGTHYASYKDYPKQFSDTEKPGLWFLEDFYKDPEAISQTILDKEFDEQLLNISGIQGSYDCNTAEELAAAVSGDIAIEYFPSSDENNEVVPEAAKLEKVTDYTVTCDSFDASTGQATITIKSAGEYKGQYQLPVRINTAAVTKEPVNKMDLTYTGEVQTLVEPGTATNGKILYAWYKKDGEDESWKKGDPDAPYSEPPGLTYTEEIPTATDAGRYAVWYKIEGDETHFNVEPQRLERVAVISPIKTKIIADDKIMKAGEKIKLAPGLDLEKAAEYGYMSLDESIVKVNSKGTVSAVAAGTATILISGTLKDGDPNYADPDDIEITVKVGKGENPIKVKAKTTKVKYSKLRKKAQKIKRAKLIAVSKAKGKRTYKLVSAKKGKKNFKKYFKVNSKNGNVTVKKGLKKGTYSVKVKVKAAGNASYKPSSWKYVTTKVRVK